VVGDSQLIDDDQWHTLTMDVRRIREVYPDLQHLRQWMFRTSWATVPPAVGWLNFPAVNARFTSHPDGPDDSAVVLLRATEPGQWIEMPFTLEEETSGEVFVRLLDHNSRGAVRIMLDDQVVVEDYEHWTDGIAPARVSLRRVGFIGLSGVGIRPEGVPEAAELTIENFEFWFDNFAILPED